MAKKITTFHIKHCLSLSLTDKSKALPVFDAVGQNYPELITPAEAYYLPDELLQALLLPKLQNDPKLGRSFIESIIQASNGFIMQFLWRFGFLDESHIWAFFTSVVIDNPDQNILNMTIWAIETDKNKKYQLPQLRFKSLLPVIHDFAQLEVLLGHSTKIDVTSHEIVSKMFENGSIQMYDYMLEKHIISPSSLDPAKIKKYLHAIFVSQNQEAALVFERFVADFSLEESCLVEIIRDSIMLFGPKITPGLFEKIQSYISIADSYHLVDNTFVAPLIIKRKELPERVRLMQNYLTVNYHNHPITILETRIALLSSIDPDWFSKVFDGSIRDPVNRSLRHTSAVKLLLDSIPKQIQPINCQNASQPGNFDSLEVLPETLFLQFDQTYVNYPIHKSPEKYMDTFLASPVVATWLMGVNARPIDHKLGYITIMMNILPIVMHIQHYGWLIEVVESFKSFLATEFNAWYEKRWPNDGFSSLPKMFQFKMFLRYLEMIILESIHLPVDSLAVRFCGYLHQIGQRESFLSIVKIMSLRLESPGFFFTLLKTASTRAIAEYLQSKPDIQTSNPFLK